MYAACSGVQLCFFSLLCSALLCSAVIDVLGGGFSTRCGGGLDLDLDLDLAGRGVGSKFNGYQVLMLIGVILDSSSTSGRSFYLHCRKLEVADPDDRSCSTEDELLPGIQIAP